VAAEAVVLPRPRSLPPDNSFQMKALSWMQRLAGELFQGVHMIAVSDGLRGVNCKGTLAFLSSDEKDKYRHKFSQVFSAEPRRELKHGVMFDSKECI
jgi:hypothetical protein